MVTAGEYGIEIAKQRSFRECFRKPLSHLVQLAR
jgi:hypothetical protein